MAQGKLKLLAALSTQGREGAARTSSRFHLDPIGWYRAPDSTEVLPTLAEAVWNARRIRIHYKSWYRKVDRELEPLGFALKAGVWYLVAQLVGKMVGSPRVYRISAIETLQSLDEVFERPIDFDLATFWGNWVTEFEARIQQGEATLRLSPQGLKRLELLGSAAEQMAARTLTSPDSAGWISVTIPIESIEHAASEVLRLGADAEVLAPPALRRRVASAIVQLSALYSCEIQQIDC
jgi:predicted DNA-binding transcriptional regulator YafY